jgi:HK97 family phage portal protein
LNILNLFKSNKRVETQAHSEAEKNYSMAQLFRWVQGVSLNRELTSLELLNSFNVVPMVGKTVRYVMNNVVDLDWHIYNEQGEDVKDDPKFKAFHKPNATMNRTQFLESVITHKLLNGFYIAELGSKTNISNDDYYLGSMWVLLPHEITIETNVHGEPDRFRYKSNTLYAKDQVLYGYDVDPTHLNIGVSRYKAASSAILTIGVINSFIHKYFKNNTHIGTFLTTDKTLSAPQFQKMKEDIENELQGQDNAFNGAMFHGGMKPENLDFQTPLESGISEALQHAEDEIITASGLSDSTIKSKDATFANGKEATRNDYKSVIKPLARGIAEDFTTQLLPDGYVYEFDFSNIAALQEDRTEDRKTNLSYYEAGALTLPQVLKMSYDMEEDEIEAEEIEIEEVSLEDEIKKSLRASLESVSLEKADTNKNKLKKQLAELDDSIMSGHIEDIEKAYLKILVMMQAVITSFETVDVEKIMKQIESKLSGMLSAISINVNSAISTAYNEAGFITAKDLKDGTYKVGSKRAASYVQERLDYISNSVGADLSETARTTLERALRENLTPEETATRLQNFYNAKYKANRLAQTEITGAINKSSFNTIKDLNVKYKQWLTIKDAKVRDSHVSLDGEIRKINEKFSNGLMFAGDFENGSAGDTINCRCYVGGVEL